MTGEEKALLIEYLVDAGEIFPDLDIDVEDQFLDWYEVRQGVVSGESLGAPPSVPGVTGSRG